MSFVGQLIIYISNRPNLENSGVGWFVLGCYESDYAGNMSGPGGHRMSSAGNIYVRANRPWCGYTGHKIYSLRRWDGSLFDLFFERSEREEKISFIKVNVTIDITKYRMYNQVVTKIITMIITV